jgi:hypothetical protein
MILSKWSAKSTWNRRSPEKTDVAERIDSATPAEIFNFINTQLGRTQK